MKISPYRIEKIKGLIEDLAGLDKLIQLHREHSGDDFMVRQYEAKKFERFQQLISQLMHPSLNKNGFNTYPLIQKLTARFYPLTESDSIKKNKFWEELDGVV
ncbi:MAG: hypothetical protein ACE5FF_13260 [Saprospiraceae bacterium]